MEALAEAILKAGAPWAGESKFADKETVKRLGARWDSEKKKWAARDEIVLRALIESGAWLPCGVGSDVAQAMVALVHKRDASAADQLIRERAEAQKEQNKGKSVMDVRKELQIPEDEPEMLQLAAEHGVDAATVTKSGLWTFLGPRSGISDARRLVRGVVRLELASWQQVASGEAADRDASRTGGDRQDKGVKREVKRVKRQECVHQGRAQENLPSRPDPSINRVKRPAEFRYTKRCEDCGVALDSRRQFGLECECAGERAWRSCESCMIPVRKAGLCTACA